VFGYIFSRKMAHTSKAIDVSIPKTSCPILVFVVLGYLIIGIISARTTTDNPIIQA
jgi:hypothetical protein